MVILGIDAHKRNHTIVAVDERGRKLGETTIRTTTADHLELVSWADRFGPEREWAVEDCRLLSRRLERDLLGAGEVITRVPPKLMAHARDAARTYGKSDPIDALAVARAALREPNLPKARLDGPSRELQLLATHREHLVAERTRAVNRLRWHLHDLDPSFDPPARCLVRAKHLRSTANFLEHHGGIVAILARDLLQRITELTASIAAIDKDIAVRIIELAPAFSRSRDAAFSPRRRSWGKPLMPQGSATKTPSPDTTAQHLSRSGRAIASDIALRAPETVS